MKLQGASAPRPLTHDLLVNILAELDDETKQEILELARSESFLLAAEDYLRSTSRLH